MLLNSPFPSVYSLFSREYVFSRICVFFQTSLSFEESDSCVYSSYIYWEFTMVKGMVLGPWRIQNENFTVLFPCDWSSLPMRHSSSLAMTLLPTHSCLPVLHSFLSYIPHESPDVTFTPGALSRLHAFTQALLYSWSFLSWLIPTYPLKTQFKRGPLEAFLDFFPPST